MSDEPKTPPVQVLAYYPEDGSASLRFLVRLILLAGAVNAGISAVSYASGYLTGWSSPPPPLEIDLVLVIGQVITWLTVAVWYLVLMNAGPGRLIAMIAQGIALLLDAGYFARQIFQYPQFFNTINMLASLVGDWVLPALIFTVLIRRDLRPR
jgi:hypothetical protein